VSAILKTLGVATRTEVVIRAGELGWRSGNPDGGAAVKSNDPTRSLALPDKPSIAVLPFTNLTGDIAHEYFADGMVEDVTMALGRLPWLFVIASTSAFTYKGRAVDVRTVGAELGVQYVLRGSVRKDHERIRAAVELADASHGRQIWTERFDCTLDDIFAMQDRVAIQVSAMIAPTLRSKGGGACTSQTNWQPGQPMTCTCGRNRPIATALPKIRNRWHCCTRRSSWIRRSPRRTAWPRGVSRYRRRSSGCHSPHR
jgi:TolB-like protein